MTLVQGLATFYESSQYPDRHALEAARIVSILVVEAGPMVTQGIEKWQVLHVAAEFSAQRAAVAASSAQLGSDAGFFNGFFGSFVSALLAMFTGATQIFFVVVLLSDRLRLFKDPVADARAWRTLVAHDAKNQDLSGNSLASQVCLESSGFMGNMITEINVYLGLDPTEFEMPAFRPGTVESVLCILVWTLCVMKELRSYWLMIQAIFWLPRAGLSKLGETVYLSRTRWWALMILYGLRTAISVLMLAGGILLLANTTSLVHMIVITAALPNLILHIDKQFFMAVMPMEIKTGIQRFKPFRIHYSRMHSQIETFVAVFLVIVVLMMSYSQVLVPLEQQRLDTKMELCGGQQAFVVAHNPASQLTYAMKSGDAPAYAAAVQAVEEHRFTSSASPASPSMVFTTAESFHSQAMRSMREEAALAPCWEEGNVTSATMNSAALALGFSARATCDELAASCHEASARLLRMTCGVTCGCSEPHSSPWYKVEAQGCSSACLASAISKAAVLPCQDVDKASSTWLDVWDQYVSVATEYLKAKRMTVDTAELLQTVETMKSEGCPRLLQQLEPATDAKWCEGHSDLFRPLAYLCPSSCGVCR
eukprot:Skav209035  [mRNA]  locus=scaffold2483:27734:31962:+ [translate_table: standard]